MIVQPVLAKVRSRQPLWQFSPHPPPHNDGAYLVFSPGSPTGKASGRFSGRRRCACFSFLSRSLPVVWLLAALGSTQVRRLNQISRQCRSEVKLIQLGSAHEGSGVRTGPYPKRLKARTDKRKLLTSL